MISSNTKFHPNNEEKLKRSGEKNQKYHNVDKELAYRYIPFIENDILLVQNTLKSVYILLRNGTILYISPEASENTVKIEIKTFFLPKTIKIPMKIIDLSCGNNHCLALGIYHKVFSWGSDSFGQLGLPDLYLASYDRKEDPTEIPSKQFQKCKKIIRIYARNNSSFAISENNYVYGWGMVMYYISELNI